MLSLRGCLVTIDSMGYQRDIAENIVAQDADYLLAVKDNQKRLEQVISQVLILVCLMVFKVN